MPIAFLKPTGQTDAGPNIATGALIDVDEGVSGADASLEVSITKQWLTPFFVEWPMQDLPGDADSINSVILRVRNRIVGTWVDDSIQYGWTIQGTNLAHPTLQWDFQADAGAGLANRQQTVTDSPTVANVNAALVRVTQAYSGSMAKEAITSDWDCFELEVDYDIAAGGQTISGTAGEITTGESVPLDLTLANATPQAISGTVGEISTGESVPVDAILANAVAQSITGTAGEIASAESFASDHSIISNAGASIFPYHAVKAARSAIRTLLTM